MFTMLNVLYDHFLTRKTTFFTLFILSRTSDNTASQNIGGDQCMNRPPPPQILGGPSSPVPPRSQPLHSYESSESFRVVVGVSESVSIKAMRVIFNNCSPLRLTKLLKISCVFTQHR